MITGDHRTTAKAIAREAGIYREGDKIITGNELQDMGHERLAEKLMAASVFARVTPEDKMKIIKAYKHLGLTIAMTGDGVNDAPSLVAADLGVAMGKIGTEVAKEAADIVLLDDNLSSIVAAIEEGRGMYRNIQKALLFLFSTSLGELLVIVLALALNLPLPVLAVQILWMNLVTDPLIGMALAMDHKEPGLLEQKFRRLPKYFMTRTMLGQMALIGAVMAAGSLYLFSLYYQVDYTKALTVSLTALSVYQWYNGFNCQFPNNSIFSRQVFRNLYLWLAVAANFGLQIFALYHPVMQKILKVAPLSWDEWAIILGVSFSIVLAEESRKMIYKILQGRKKGAARPIPAP
jgi:Ca2+-transporting ATPase